MDHLRTDLDMLMNDFLTQSNNQNAANISFFNECNMMPLLMLSFGNYHMLHYVNYFKIGFCYYILRKNKNLDQIYIVIYIY